MLSRIYGKSVHMIRANMNLATAWEDTVDIFVTNILWTLLLGVKLDPWMTPPDQCEITLCFCCCSKYVEHSTGLGRDYFPSQQLKCHHNLNQGKMSIHRAEMGLTSFGMVSSWEPVCAEASIPAEDTAREPQWAPWRGEVLENQKQLPLLPSICPPTLEALVAMCNGEGALLHGQLV